MNIFVTTDLYSDYLIVSKLTSELKGYDLSKCVLLTTDRPQDKPFISYALINGLEFKVYNIKDYLTEEIIKKVASNIDFLIIFSDMGNYFYQTLFKVCDNTIYIGEEKLDIELYKKYLNINYDKAVQSNLKKKVDTVGLYKKEVVDKLRTVRRVKIKINSMGLRSLK